MPHSIHDSYPEMIPSQEDDISQRYWNVNLPPDQWTEECPAFLAGSSDKDKQIIGTRDEMYHFHTWSEVEEFVGKCQASM
jgi:hypothetical protein